MTNSTSENGSGTKCGIDLLDLVLLIGMQRRSGELFVESGNNIGSLLFHEGRILLAFSPYTRAIGDLLVDRGVLSDVELLEVLKQQRIGPHTPVGTLLLKTGKVTFHDIESMVHDQIRKSISDFCAWSDVEMNFKDKNVQPFDTINLQVYEFIPTRSKQAAALFVAGMVNAVDAAPASD